MGGGKDLLRIGKCSEAGCRSVQRSSVKVLNCYYANENMSKCRACLACRCIDSRRLTRASLALLTRHAIAGMLDGTRRNDQHHVFLFDFASGGIDILSGGLPFFHYPTCRLQQADFFHRRALKCSPLAQTGPHGRLDERLHCWSMRILPCYHGLGAGGDEKNLAKG